MTTLTTFHILEARLKAGDLLYLTTEFIIDKDAVYKIKTSDETIYVMHQDKVDDFIHACTSVGIGVIPAREYWDEQQKVLVTIR